MGLASQLKLWAQGQWRWRLLAVGVLASGTLLIPAAVGRADSQAMFTYSPSAPLTGQIVTFTSTSTGTVNSQSWDLDNDNACDDGTGKTAQRSFPTPGQYAIRLCVNGTESEQKRTITVANRPPVASFSVFPSNPVAGQLVELTSTSVDPDGTIVADDWALDSDGLFGDGSTATVSRAWTRPGTYPVRLKVVDGNGASSIVTEWIRIGRPPLRLLSPFPIVRLTGRLTPTGTRISTLLVQAPRGARVSVRCHGRACPYRRAAARSRRGSVRFRRLQRLLPAGTVLEIYVTKSGTIGKYTRFGIHRNSAPTRMDRCFKAGGKAPVACPA